MTKKYAVRYAKARWNWALDKGSWAKAYVHAWRLHGRMPRGRFRQVVRAHFDRPSRIDRMARVLYGPDLPPRKNYQLYITMQKNTGDWTK